MCETHSAGLWTVGTGAGTNSARLAFVVALQFILLMVTLSPIQDRLISVLDHNGDPATHPIHNVPPLPPITSLNGLPSTLPNTTAEVTSKTPVTTYPVGAASPPISTNTREQLNAALYLSQALLGIPSISALSPFFQSELLSASAGRFLSVCTCLIRQSVKLSTEHYVQSPSRINYLSASFAVQMDSGNYTLFHSLISSSPLCSPRHG